MLHIKLDDIDSSLSLMTALYDEESYQLEENKTEPSLGLRYYNVTLPCNMLR